MSLTRHQALELLGYRCTTAGNPPEIVEWHDERPQPESWEAILLAAAEIAPPREWPSASAFLDEFTHVERGAIWLCEHAMVGSLVLKLTAWQGIVLANDPHIVAGMGLLVSLGILTEERKAAILGS